MASFKVVNRLNVNIESSPRVRSSRGCTRGEGIVQTIVYNHIRNPQRSLDLLEESLHIGRVCQVYSKVKQAIL